MAYGSNRPSDTTELPPSRPQTSLFECHVEPWSALDGHLQVVGEDGDGLQPFLDHDPALDVRGLRPEPIDVHLPKDAGHLFEPRGDVREPGPLVWGANTPIGRVRCGNA